MKSDASHSMNVDQEFLSSLFSKRKEHRLGRNSFSSLDITPAERKKLYEMAQQRGLLTSYEFSGIQSFGISRNDAARTMLQKTRERALEKLRNEFGAKAHFWVNPRQLWSVDFYWRSARVGVVITGPLQDDLSRGARVRRRDSRVGAKQRSVSIPGVNSWNLTLLSFPYYAIWHHPSDFLSRIKHKLIVS